MGQDYGPAMMMMIQQTAGHVLVEGGGGGGPLAGGASQTETSDCCQLSRCVCGAVENPNRKSWSSWPDLIIPSCLKWVTNLEFFFSFSCHCLPVWKNESLWVAKNPHFFGKNWSPPAEFNHSFASCQFWHFFVYQGVRVFRQQHKTFHTNQNHNYWMRWVKMKDMTKQRLRQ